MSPKLIPMTLKEPASEQLDPEPAAGPQSGEKLNFAMAIMQYNQAFVNFIDGKANSLLLANSIFLATGVQAGLASFLPVTAVGVAATAILLCLWVVYARMPGPMKRDRAKLVFFGHICQRSNRTSYLEDFRCATPHEILESLLRQIYDLSGVVDRKFRAYRTSQLATIVSAALWIGNVLSPLLARLH